MLLNAFVDGDRLALVTRSSGKRVVRSVSAEWVVFLRADKVSTNIENGLRSSAAVKSIRREGEWLRIGFLGPESRRIATQREGFFACHGLEHFEGDVDPVRRYLTDTDTPIGKPNRCYFDLETDSRVPFSRKDQARILSWTVTDEVQGLVARNILAEDTDRAEATLVSELWKALEPYDQVLAWNGDGFDFPVLGARTDHLRVKADPRLWLWLDHLLLFKKMNMHAAESGDEKRSMKLDAIAQAVLGEGKDNFDARKTWEAWEAGGESRARLLEYNTKDAILLPKIEAKKGFALLFDAIAQACSVFPDTSGLAPTRQVDGFMLKLGMKHGKHFASRVYREGAGEKQYKGAQVVKPKIHGIGRDIHVCDFSRMYPSIMLTFNMSPETLTSAPVNGPLPPNTCRCPTTGETFRTDVQGLLCIALLELIGQRDFWNKKKASLQPGTAEWHDADSRSSALKSTINAFYGVFGNAFSRYFDWRIAESITQTGVWLIKQTINAIEERGWEVVYSDTDSSFVRGCTKQEFSVFVAWCNTDLYPPLIAKCGCAINDISIAYEKAYDRLIFSNAKRYCNPPEAPIWMADGSFKQLDDVRVGDVVFGWVDGKWGVGRRQPGKKTVTRKRIFGSDRSRRKLTTSEVVAVHRHRATIVRVTFESGRVLRCTPDHRWRIHGRSGTYSDYVPAKVGRIISHVVDQPRRLSFDEQRAADWLGGIWDGEGSLASDNRGQILISQSRIKNPEVCTRIEESIKKLGWNYGVRTQRSAGNDCETFNIHGSLQERLEFITWCRPAKAGRMAKSLFKSRFSNPDCVVSVVPDGEGEVIGLTTTTGNYVVWGFASKNCATYSHYKGKAPKPLPQLDEKFDPDKHSHPEVKGLEYKRGDATKLAAKLQERAIHMLMLGEERISEYEDLAEQALDHVLNDPLPLEEVVQSAGLSKGLKEYKTKAKKDGSEGADIIHVAIGKELAKRGYQMGEGQRVEWVIMDSTTTPMTAVPAEDYKGECDRFYVWENRVWKPTQRLLEAAFPDHLWRRLERIRPQKGRHKPPPKDQAAFDFPVEKPSVRIPPRMLPREPFRQIDLSKPDFTMTTTPWELHLSDLDDFGVLREVLLRFPGTRPVKIVVHLQDGVRALADSKLTVDGSSALDRSIEGARENAWFAAMTYANG